MSDDNRAGLSGSDLQDSQSGGASGEFSGNRDERQSDALGGGAGAADMDQAGGSSGTGGYGNAQNQQNHQGQQGNARGTDPSQSRGERFDEMQGGGRGVESLSGDDGDPAADPALDAAADELLADQQAHQDRGQSAAEEEEQQA
jgi:hypothetical protein